MWDDPTCNQVVNQTFLTMDYQDTRGYNKFDLSFLRVCPVINLSLASKLPPEKLNSYEIFHELLMVGGRLESSCSDQAIVHSIGFFQGCRLLAWLEGKCRQGENQEHLLQKSTTDAAKYGNQKFSGIDGARLG